MEIGILLLRTVAGLVIAAHGAQKLFGWFGGHGLEGTGGFLESLGFRPGRPYAWLNGLAEFGGGLLLALGLFTPLGAAAVLGVMVVATALVHWDNGFFNTNGGFEFPLTLATAAIAVAFTGPGAISLDALLGTAVSGFGWGLAAIVVGLLAAGAVLTARTTQPEEAEVREAA